MDSRVLAYGDGVFETLRYRSGSFVLWDLHYKRLQLGLTALGFADSYSGISLHDFIEREILLTYGPEADLMVKIVLARDQGEGYRPSGDSSVTEIVTIKPYMPPALELYKSGFSTRILTWRLAKDCQLAHLKHLNKLPHVMASRELNNGEFEGLLLDSDDYLIEGTRSNLLLLVNGCWVTPDLRQAGVRGVMRSYLLTVAGSVSYSAALEIKAIHKDQLSEIEAMAVCNSLFGLIPVACLHGRQLDVAAVTEVWHKPLHSALKLPGG